MSEHQAIINEIEEMDRKRRALVRKLTVGVPETARVLDHAPRWWDCVEDEFVSGVAHMEYEYAIDDAGNLWVSEDEGEPIEVPRWVLVFAGSSDE
jgi:hypothetical protein